MNKSLTYDHLLNACSAGGSTALTIRTELAPAGGSHATVAPPRYVSGNNTPTFAFETRFIDKEPVNAVILDAKQSVPVGVHRAGRGLTVLGILDQRGDQDQLDVRTDPLSARVLQIHPNQHLRTGA